MFKKLLIVLVILVGGSLGGLWYLGGRTLPAPGEEVGLRAAVSNIATSLPTKKKVLDQDGDKIPDWQETLKGTDPLNADSDGDRLPDNQEPVINPEDHALRIVVNAATKKDTPLLPIDDLTSGIARRYSLEDLNLVGENSEAFLMEYGKNMAKIMSAFIEPGIGYEAALTLEAVETGNTDLVEEINPAITRYQTAINQLRALPTPETAGAIQLNLVNSLSRLLSDSTLMAELETEPTLAMGAANMQSSHLRQLITALGTLNFFFAGHNLTFAEGDKVKITLGV